ncbi:N-acetylneuraminate synthase family protein [Treponema sp.]
MELYIMTNIPSILPKSFHIKPYDYHSQRVLVIAELGTSHGADRLKAKELVDAAAEAGADCVKLQLVYADEILHPNTGEVQLPGGRLRLYDVFKRLELSLDFFVELKEYVEARNLVFLCTPFGIKSAQELRSLGVKAMKLASPELNHLSLVQELASYELPTLISSGVSRLADIERALDYFSPEKTCLLHCVTAYPAPETEYNLRLLPSLSALFGVSVGVSDHSLDAELVPSLSVCMGAVAIEKHFCLSRSDPGLDDSIALDPPDFIKMVRAIREVEKLGREAALSAIEKERGARLVNTVLGDGVKRLAASEKANYTRTNRSIHVLRDIQQGEILQKEDIASLRTEKNLRPGLEPLWEPLIPGRQAREFIASGEGLRFTDI